MAVDYTHHAGVFLVYLAVDVALYVALRSVALHWFSIADVILHEIVLGGDGAWCSVTRHEELIWLYRVSCREMAIGI